jgi:hypothetical protein
MVTVKFGEKDTYQEWGLITNFIDPGIPTVKTNYIDIPGGNGSIDLTEASGGPKYNDRKPLMKFTLRSRAEVIARNFMNTVHGKKMKIVLGSEPDFYYIGRPTITEQSHSGNLTLFTVEGTFEPYKYVHRETVHTEAITGNKDFIVLNLQKPVIPIIEVSSDLTLTFKGLQFAFVGGKKYKAAGIVLEGGCNRFTAAGTGIITFTYQEGVI